MQPDHITWDEFSARRTARPSTTTHGSPDEPGETGEEPASQPKLSKSKRREPSLSNVLMQAIQLAGARRGRLSRAERIRESTLLEVLSTTMRSAR